MKRPIINPKKCGNCPSCGGADVCDRQAFIRECPDDKPWIDFYACRGCMRCKAACVHDAIEELIQPCTGGRRMGW